ncbi:exodeoxyribonuclease VII large subunit [Haloplasma contractile]|uniref:Exodeoxyribonuclease 7 large subunit n=1 Tax=Haloplasma contractile SSD-17B TaxID=1033810 RepID=U2EGN1_9MOLU|nr:exodeoxyribonuclease VII large subunit [Haloplasma contractile]ERJ13776.1 Exodeoxyribonuclease 7 large subunit protein [Haloplasma contractile SSD-17B]
MDKTPLTVTALNKYLKHKFDHDVNLQTVLLKGEISNFKRHSRGHLYFTLKDENSQLSAIMFSSKASKLKFDVEDGMNVVVEGSVSLYLRGGSYQIYVNNIVVDGIGQLYVKYEQLKEKLEKQGYFDPRYKKEKPRYPKKIGVCTSDTGAAIRDIITTITRRYPIVEVMIFPTLVQGEHAKTSIVQQIEAANSLKDIDLLIIGRGGGSIEDLWAFNEEVVANAIFNSKIPIISAVGHETDFTIADFVADFRAPTPTAAAELAVPDSQELLISLNNVNRHLNQLIINKHKGLKDHYLRLASSYVFTNPSRIFEQFNMRLDHIMTKLEKNTPYTVVKEKKSQFDQHVSRLNYAYERTIVRNVNQFNNLLNKLEILNPISILQKGYSIAVKEGAVITNVNDIEKDDTFELTVSNGKLHCTVQDKQVKEDDQNG